MKIIKREEFDSHIDHPGTSCGLCFVDENNVLLVSVYRKTIGYCLEIPGGVRERSESFSECLDREIYEETGYIVNKKAFLYEFYTSIGITNEIVKLYACLVTQKFNKSEHNVCIVPYKQALELVANNKIVDNKTIISLLKYNSEDQIHHIANHLTPTRSRHTRSLALTTKTFHVRSHFLG